MFLGSGKLLPNDAAPFEERIDGRRGRLWICPSSSVVSDLDILEGGQGAVELGPNATLCSLPYIYAAGCVRGATLRKVRHMNIGQSD